MHSQDLGLKLYTVEGTRNDVGVITSSSESSPKIDGRERGTDFEALFWGKMRPYLRSKSAEIHYTDHTHQYTHRDLLIQEQHILHARC